MSNYFKNDLNKGLLAALFILAVIFYSFYQYRPPRVVPKDAPPDVFSAQRAMELLPDICSKPHPVGSPEHLRIRQYLIDYLKKAGYSPELQLAEVCYPEYYRAATVGNIMIRIPGTNNTKPVLVMGHYDSVDDSYGASDDGSAIVTMLETLRVLKNQAPLMNDVIFLFTDAEEMGLLGARAFVEQHPWAKDIGIVLNFEASGTKGSGMLFETSPDNNWIISEFAKASSHPVANSLNYEIYRKMPNSTDLTPFKISGYKCLNFAFLENRYDYHNYGDNIPNTSPASIQHQGYYATELTRHFGNLDLNNSPKGDAVFFNIPGNGFVHYPYKWILPFVILTVLVFVLVLVTGIKRKIIRPFRSILGFVAFIFHIAIAPAIVTCIYFIITRYFRGGDSRLLYYNYIPLLLSFVCISVAISFVYIKLLERGVRLWHVLIFAILMMILLLWSGKMSIITSLATLVVSSLIYILFRKPTGTWELNIGSAFGWTILMITASLMMPGVSYLFTWSLLFLLIPVLITFLQKEHNNLSVFQTGLFLVFSIPVISWFSVITYLFLVAMGLGMSGAVVLLAALCLTLLIPHIDIITRARPWLIPVLTLFFGILFLFKGTVGREYNERYRKFNSMVYAVDADSMKAYWTTLDAETDEWTGKFLTDNPAKGMMSDFFPFENRKLFYREIQYSPLLSPSITVLNDSTGNDRFLKLHLVSGRKAGYLDILLKTDSGVLRAGINKFPVREMYRLRETGWYYIRYYNFPAIGIDLNLELEPGKKVEIRLIDIVTGLPDFLPDKPVERPAYMMAKGDRSLVSRRFVI